MTPSSNSFVQRVRQPWMGFQPADYNPIYIENICKNLFQPQPTHGYVKERVHYTRFEIVVGHEPHKKSPYHEH